MKTSKVYILIDSISEDDKDIFLAPSNLQDAKLGKGGFGTVFLASFCGEIVAAKKANSTQLRDQNALKKEIEIQAKLDHPNILPLFAIVLDTSSQPKWILSEYMVFGSIKELLEYDGLEEGLPFLPIIQICKDIFSGLMYLHCEAKVMHRDVKPANILIGYNGMCKIGDFGISKLDVISKLHQENDSFHQLYNHSNENGSEFYVAPEYLSGNYNEKIDNWCAGIVALELILGNKVCDIGLDDSLKNDAKICLRKKNLDNSLKNEAESFLQDLDKFIDKSLEKNPSNRASSTELLDFLPKITKPEMVLDLLQQVTGENDS